MALRKFTAMLFLAVLTTASTAAQVKQDFVDGLAAYDAGDYATAADLWRGLAEAGDAGAQAALAGLHAQGLGVRPDPAAAAEWYRRAARQGHVVAQMNLGESYAAGRGVPRDPVRALAWLTLAAERGHAWARRRLEELSAAATPEQRAAAVRLAERLLDDGG